MNLKKITYLLGWLLIGIGVLGLLGMGTASIQIPASAQKLDNYSYVEQLPNGQCRLTIHSQPLNSFFLFDIMGIETDSRRYTVNNSYPTESGLGSIYAVNKTDSGGNHCIRNGYCEFNFRTLPVESITYATLHFRACTVYAETVWLEIYQCGNIDHSAINWNNQPSRGSNPLDTVIVPPETNPDGSWETYQRDVTNTVTGEFSQDKIVTFGFITQEESGFAYIARYNIDPFPTLTIDYTPSQSGGSSSGSSSSSTESAENYTSNNTGSPLENVQSGPGWHHWPLICIIIGIILVGYSTNGRFFR